ncbi:short-chain dehydrogenase/reductase [Xylona heveae TC161]|uniref:Short-chain dehydrogenase/reductase n=1 Tax=Xylona heveae (strain CBS 132557 / TC161) TaxID=1328760 RepID=A0A165FD39_XYLHT|nr:short-chain dehydrogenase/reductase [Xylona heveae TC161]KZF20843.1 short-chain dehydrogenase/reductase [Xylona heveae TC161]
MFGSSKYHPETDIPDLSGKVILITGGNTGLGKETILQLAKHNPSAIYLAARTQSKAEGAIEFIRSAVPELNQDHPQTKLIYLPLDLTSFGSIKAAAESFNASSTRLDILINNAGIMATPMGTTTEGYEIQFGTNHVGHALFTKLLLPTLLRTSEESNSDVRIINVSSEGHRLAPSAAVVTDTTVLGKSNTWRRYGNSKLANIYFAKELARRYPSIKSVAVHPGVIYTNLYASTTSAFGFVSKIALTVASWFMSSVPQGARNQLWAATTKPAKEVETGAFYVPVGRKSGGSGLARNDDRARKLWDWTEAEFAKHGF